MDKKQERAMLRLVDDAKKRFGTRTLDSNDPEFISLVYKARARFLGKPPIAVTPGIRDFVKERLSRCGLEKVGADLPSVAEFWDIFDDYDFQVLMGRIPEAH
jgi:hypothetical protein